MKIAAFQAPLLAGGSVEAISLIEDRVAWCESEGVSILCCPEAILGGLADYAENPERFAIRTDNGHLARVLAPLTNDSVTSIIGLQNSPTVASSTTQQRYFTKVESLVYTANCIRQSDSQFIQPDQQIPCSEWVD